MQRLSPLLISILVLASLLAHHAHGTEAKADAPAPAATAGHVQHGVQELQVIDHGALDDILPDLCTIGDPAPPSPSTTNGHAAALILVADADPILPAPSFPSIWEAPVYPPDVLRALLQVFLN